MDEAEGALGAADHPGRPRSPGEREVFLGELERVIVAPGRVRGERGRPG
jgi:hypothetical protein